MSFTAKVRLQGLFRIVLQEERSPARLVALAPWVQPTSEICPHHLMIRWRPFQTGADVPLGTQASWPLEGVQIRIGTGQEGDGISANLDQLALPRMFALRDSDGVEDPATGIFPNEARGAMALREGLLSDDPESFGFAVDELGNEDRRRNSAGLMAQVMIDHGEVLVDQPQAASFARIEPTVWPEPAEPYQGHFVNSIDICLDDLDRLEVQVVDLVRGASRQPLELVADEERLQGTALELEILHLCPDLIVGSPMPLAAVEATPGGLHHVRSRDEDFAVLYQLSSAPQDLSRPAGFSDTRLPVPVREGEPAGNRAFECGPVVERGEENDD